MVNENLTKEELQEKKDKEELARNYCKEIEAKLKKEERRLWMFNDLDHIGQ